MRLSYAVLWAIVNFLVFIQPAKAGEIEQERQRMDSPFLARASENWYFTPANCCGLVAAYMVTNDLGHPIALRDLASQLRITSVGTSMYDLETFLQRCGFDTAAVEVETAELYAILERHPRLRAIALVRPAHWITLFSAGQGRFDCFSYPERVDLGRNQFDRFFAKRVLLIGPSPGSLDYLRNPSPFGASSLLFSVLMGLIAGIVVVALFIYRRRIRRSIANRCPSDCP